MMLLALAALPAGCGGGGGGGGGGTPAAPTQTTIKVTPADPVVAPGSSQQFVATEFFTDGSTKVLTSGVTWSTSGVAQIDASGFASSPGVGVGTATITASFGAFTDSTPLTVTAGSTPAANVMAITVNGSLCSPATTNVNGQTNYLNKPCVSVTVCNPGTSTCQTVKDILLDTGSYGLRLFKETITGLSLPQVPSGSGLLAECIRFADNSTVWGPVMRADVQMGGEAAVTMPIQVIDSTFARPAACGTPDPSPAIAGYSGVLGVGPAIQDCGTTCTQSAIGVYFSCPSATTGTACSGTTVPLTNQVPNPVAGLGSDNNGILVQLPGIPLGGATSLNGFLIFGVGTRANNTPAGPTVLPTTQQGDFTTTISGMSGSFNGFLDTGSNALFLPSALPSCGGTNSAWYCPPSTTALTVTLGVGTSQPDAVQLNFGNANALFSTPNNVFSELGGTSTFGFDGGLPFFIGRSIFIGYDGRATSLGTGPYVAF